jgi:hypothetical protein
MRRLLVGAALILISAAPFVGCDVVEGPSCCALKRFCSVCTTCNDKTMGASARGDEAACKAVVEEFRKGNQFCHPNDDPPKHTIDEFVLECEQ